MTSKHDRSVEEMERARLEEGRIWSQRNPETGMGAAVGYGEPFWWAQSRASTPFYVHPLYGPQIPVSPPIPGIFQGTLSAPQTGSVQGLPGSYQTMQSQPLPSSGMTQFHQNPFLYSNPLHPAFSLMNPFGQPFVPGFSSNPYQIHPLLQNPGLETQWPGQLGWEGVAQRGPFPRQAPRAFYRPPRSYKRSDELIRDEICKRLALTPEIDVTDVDVIVKDGEVTLKGVVDDRFTKRIVEDITESTFGVRDVLNDIRIGSRFAEQDKYGASKGKEK